MTHAQARHNRRIANRKLGSNNPDFGKSIPGQLSTVEIAHKQRRKASRHFNLGKRQRDTEQEIKELENLVTALNGIASNEKRPKEERESAKLASRQREFRISALKKTLAQVNASLAAL